MPGRRNARGPATLLLAPTATTLAVIRPNQPTGIFHPLEVTSDLSAWLLPVDAYPLECDGLTRVISTLLTREAITHAVRVGTVEIDGAGRIPLHWWIELPESIVIDYRARMWLGDTPQTPHGVFKPSPAQRYVANPRADTGPGGPLSPLSGTLFRVLSGSSLNAYPRFKRG